MTATDTARPDSPTVALLRRARARIEKPECWTQRVTARDAKGWSARADADNAVCWCIEGAVRAECAGQLPAAVWGAIRRVCDKPNDFNDHPKTTHAAILNLVDHAIEREALLS